MSDHENVNTIINYLESLGLRIEPPVFRTETESQVEDGQVRVTLSLLVEQPFRIVPIEGRTVDYQALRPLLQAISTRQLDRSRPS